jgi:pentatricopeptide repeat protein
METLGLKPTDETYNQVMTAFAKNRDVAMVEQLNQEAIVKHGLKPSKYRLNALILAYCKKGEPINAEKVLREMVKDGIRPDNITYTTVIDAYKRQRQIDKCWELYDYYTSNAGLEGDGRDADEFLLGYMVRLCAATHDSEKAIRIFNEMEQHGFVRHAIPYNSIIFALASTKRYSEKAIDYWRQMHAHNIVPDRHTFVAVLKACSQLGDVKTAYDVLQEMKVHGFPMTEHVYNELIRVYAGACRQPDVPEKHVDMYLSDAMALFRTVERDEKNEGVEVNI